MANILKWIFLGLGWAIYGPIGGLLGYGIGSAIGGGNRSVRKSPSDADFNTSRPHRGPYRNTGTADDLHVALIVLVAAVMKADGAVKRSELDYVKRFLLANYGEQRGTEMLHLLRDLVSKDIPVNEVCGQIKVNTSYDTRLHMVDFLCTLCGVDDEFHPAEVRLLRNIALQLGISSSDLLSVFVRHRIYTESSYQQQHQHQQTSTASNEKDPYRVLGIDSSATDDEVKRAYRRMVMKYHPDRVANLGEEMQRNAAEQMQEINRAYDIIKSSRSSMK